MASSTTTTTTVADSQGIKITSVPTQPIEGQKTGTSGLRKKVCFFVDLFLGLDWIGLDLSWNLKCVLLFLFIRLNCLWKTIISETGFRHCLILCHQKILKMVYGYWEVMGDTSIATRHSLVVNLISDVKRMQIIIEIAAGNDVGKILVGRDGIMSTPAVSAVIRKRKANGGFIMSASHNPGGPEYDWGIKFNYNNGQPTPESITDKIYGNILSVSSAPSENVHILPTATEIYAKIVEKTRVFQFLAGLNPDFEYARVHLLDRTPFPTLEEAHSYCLSDQSRRSPMPPISGIPLETSTMAIRYAYPAPPSVPSQTSHTSLPSISPLPATATSGIEPSSTASIPVTTDDDSPVSHSDDDRPIVIPKEKLPLASCSSDTSKHDKIPKDMCSSDKISEIKVADIPDVDLSRVGVTEYGNFVIEVIDPVSDYLRVNGGFKFYCTMTSYSNRYSVLLPRFKFDAMHTVTGAYAKPIFLDSLGASPDSIANGVPLESFGHGHPYPNLTYAKDLVDIMYGEGRPDFGAASHRDGDRNMILGKGFFITPSDSVAIISANARAAIPYFKNSPKGLTQSMPTSCTLDCVAEKLKLLFFEVPTSWKFFGNLMDNEKLSICGEESFGTGSDHIREKDGIWAVLAWLSIIAYRNKDKRSGEKLVSVADVAKEHCAECESEGANKMVGHLRDILSKSKSGDKYGDYALQFADDFTYTDPVDGSIAAKQGVSFVFTDGSRIIFRLSGTGSASATVRIYIEQFEPDVSKHDLDAHIALKPLIDLALSVSKLKEFTGRGKPTVITYISILDYEVHVIQVPYI
ncbi:hypothetical protein GIB67_019117 [Kingdonia uniflora]|uniref:Phosphoglucomutase n=1 Tax=Kingdonia uniflora TaxID=39325 RepID=A0A7J7N079_9MAGN|nr:hypothetical protein GIB67_019117 [Kingdonia uniflora]